MPSIHLPTKTANGANATRRRGRHRSCRLRLSTEQTLARLSSSITNATSTRPGDEGIGELGGKQRLSANWLAPITMIDRDGTFPDAHRNHCGRGLARRTLKFRGRGRRSRMHGLPMNRCAQLIDHDDRKRAVGDPWVASEATGEFLAMVDRTAGRRKFEAGPVAQRSAVLQIEIIGPHHDPCSRWSGDAGVRCVGTRNPACVRVARVDTRLARSKFHEVQQVKRAAAGPRSLPATFGCIVPICSKSARADPLRAISSA